MFGETKANQKVNETREKHNRPNGVWSLVPGLTILLDYLCLLYWIPLAIGSFETAKYYTLGPETLSLFFVYTVYKDRIEQEENSLYKTNTYIHQSECLCKFCHQ